MVVIVKLDKVYLKTQLKLNSSCFSDLNNFPLPASSFPSKTLPNLNENIF